MVKLATASVVVMFGIVWPAGAEWKRHAVDPGGVGKVGADGVRLGDVDGDGLTDIVTGWEQSGQVRIYRNPGSAVVRDAWPAVTVGVVPGVEDAMFVDFDGNGSLDVLTCAEGKSRRVYLHRAPAEGGAYFRAASWNTVEVADGQMWMFGCLDGEVVYLGSKGVGAGISRGRWVGGRLELGRLADAGWVMTLAAIDLDGEAGKELLVTDRKGARRGVWCWRESVGMELVGGLGREVMFADVGDVDGDGQGEVAVATRDGVWLVCALVDGRWQEKVYPNPMGTRCGKAVAIGDIDLDGSNDVVMSFNTLSEKGKPGVVWAKKSGDEWSAFEVSGLEGKKFDLVELLDLDADGDLDVLTCEEADNLGVIWYENPER